MVTEGSRGNKEEEERLCGSRGPSVRGWSPSQRAAPASRDSHSSRKARGQLPTDQMHRELDPAALNTAPGAFINKRAVYFIVLFVFQRKVHVIAPLSLWRFQGTCRYFSRLVREGPAAQEEGPVLGLAAEPSWSAPLASALLSQGRLVWGGSGRSGRSGRSGCGLFLPLPQGGGLLLLLRVALHVGAAALHLIKHPAAR